MKKVLIVEDHSFLSAYLVSKIRVATGLEVDVASSFDEAVKLIIETVRFRASSNKKSISGRFGDEPKNSLY